MNEWKTHAIAWEVVVVGEKRISHSEIISTAVFVSVSALCFFLNGAYQNRSHVINIETTKPMHTQRKYSRSKNFNWYITHLKVLAYLLVHWLQEWFVDSLKYSTQACNTNTHQSLPPTFPPSRSLSVFVCLFACLPVLPFYICFCIDLFSHSIYQSMHAYLYRLWYQLELWYVYIFTLQKKICANK